MGVVDKKIRITIIFSQKGLGAMKKNLQSLNAAMNAPLSRMKEIQTAQGGWNKKTKEGGTRLGQLGLGVRNATHGLKGFKMEMLGVMFFGMAMTRMFGGLLKTSTEWTGIMDILSMTLGVVFLPVMLLLLELLLPVFQWFMNMPDSVKMVIGIFVVLGLIVGFLLMIFGQLVLGIGSLILAWPVLSAVMWPVIAILAGLGFIFVGLIEIIKNWGKNWSKVIKGVGIVIMGIGIILLLFIGWWALIPIAVGLAIALIAKYWDSLPGWITGPLKAIWSLIDMFFLEPIRDLISLLKSLWDLIKSVFSGSGFIKGVKNVGKAAASFALPGFATGGIVPGGLGEPTPILAHGGERVIPANRVQREDGGGGGETIINNQFFGFTMDELNRELDRRDSSLLDTLKRNG